MAFVNLPASVQSIIQAIDARLLRIEQSQRFTFPPVATDPSNPRIGDAWLNTTTNQAKIVDSAGVVRVLTWT
jgi:hypothetical protein